MITNKKIDINSYLLKKRMYYQKSISPLFLEYYDNITEFVDILFVKEDFKIDSFYNIRSLRMLQVIFRLNKEMYESNLLDFNLSSIKELLILDNIILIFDNIKNNNFKFCNVTLSKIISKKLQNDIEELLKILPGFIVNSSIPMTTYEQWGWQQMICMKILKKINQFELCNMKFKTNILLNMPNNFTEKTINFLINEKKSEINIITLYLYLEDEEIEDVTKEYCLNLIGENE